MLNEKLILKSGSDYKNFSEIRIEENSEKCLTVKHDNPDIEDNAVTGREYTYAVSKKYSVTLVKHDITRDIVPIPELVKHVEHYNQLMHEAMKKVVCKIETPFDTTFKRVRTAETVIGNFIADLMRKHFSADCALFNSGTIRSDIVYEPGFMTIGDWNDTNPYRKDIDKVLMTGN